MPFPVVPTPTGLGGQALPDWIGALLRLVSLSDVEARVVALDQPAADLIDAVQEGRVMSEEARETHPLVTGRFNPLLRAIYQEVLRAAQDRPETVTVCYPAEGLPGGAAGSYNKETQEIELNPTRLRTRAVVYKNLPPTSQPAQQTLTHELLHFLSTQLLPELARAQPSSFPDVAQMGWLRRLLLGGPTGEDVQSTLGRTEYQHDLIRYLLGSDKRPGSLEEIAQIQPLTEKPPMNEPMRMVYNAVIQAIFKDPNLLQQILLQR